MPPSISSASGSKRRDLSQTRSNHRDHSVDSRDTTTEKFPDFVEFSSFVTSNSFGASLAPPPQEARLNGYQNGGPALSGVNWGVTSQPARGHGRKTSINEAIHNIRTRNGSVSQNAHEIADALRAPVSPTLIVCCLQYAQKHPACAQPLIRKV